MDKSISTTKKNLRWTSNRKVLITERNKNHSRLPGAPSSAPCTGCVPWGRAPFRRAWSVCAARAARPPAVRPAKPKKKKMAKCRVKNLVACSTSFSLVLVEPNWTEWASVYSKTDLTPLQHQSSWVPVLWKPSYPVVNDWLQSGARFGQWRPVGPQWKPSSIHAEPRLD